MCNNSLIDQETGFGPACCFVSQTNFAFFFLHTRNCTELYVTIVWIRSFIANSCFAAGIPNKQGPPGLQAVQSTPLCPCTQQLFLKHSASQAGLGAGLWPWHEQLHQRLQWQKFCQHNKGHRLAPLTGYQVGCLGPKVLDTADHYQA